MFNYQSVLYILNVSFFLTKNNKKYTLNKYQKTILKEVIFTMPVKKKAAKKTAKKTVKRTVKKAAPKKKTAKKTTKKVTARKKTTKKKK